MWVNFPRNLSQDSLTLSLRAIKDLKNHSSFEDEGVSLRAVIYLVQLYHYITCISLVYLVQLYHYTRYSLYLYS